MTTTGTEFRIGALALKAGVSVDTLRYYERLGLLAPVRRTPAGYRVYADSAVGELGFIRAAQRLGMSLDDIGALKSAAKHERLALADVRALLRRKLAATDDQLAALQQGRQELQRMLLRLRCGDDQKVPEHVLHRIQV